MSAHIDPNGEYRAVREQVNSCCFAVFAFVLVIVAVGVLWHYFGPITAAVRSWFA